MMMRIDVEFNGRERTFRTNESGAYLFIGDASNNQISHESGFNSLSRMKRAIREHLRVEWERDHGFDDTKMPRIKYIPSKTADWKK